MKAWLRASPQEGPKGPFSIFVPALVSSQLPMAGTPEGGEESWHQNMN
jgi:hypothetical protein